MTIGRALPHNADAEASVLGGILLNPKEALNQVLENLTPEDFYVPAFQEIFRAVLTLYEATKPIDLITLEEQLRVTNKLKAIGGVEAMAELSTRVPTTQNIGHYAQIVRDKATLRGLIRSCSEIASNAHGEEHDVDVFLDQAEQQIFQLTQRATKTSYVSVKQLLVDVFNNIEKRYDRRDSMTGVPSGFMQLDKLTTGFQRSDLVILAARPSVGKTAFCLNVAQHCATKHNIPVLVFSLEMSKESLIERVLCSEARVDSTKLRGGYLDKEDWMNLTKAASHIAEAPLWIDDSAAPSILEIRAKARRFRADKTIFSDPDQMGMVIVDYLQLVRSTRYEQNREREVAEVSRGLKALAKEVGLPVIALSQLRRAAEDRKDGRPQLSDLRESGAIEQDADLIMFIHRTQEDKEQGTAELIIGKHRNGPIGTVPLVFLSSYTRFESRAEEYES